MSRRMSSSARGGSVTLTTSAPSRAGNGDWGFLNISLKMGDEMDRMALWTRKSHSSVLSIVGPFSVRVARRITSPSGQLNISSESMLAVRGGGRVAEAPKDELDGLKTGDQRSKLMKKIEFKL